MFSSYLITHEMFTHNNKKEAQEKRIPVAYEGTLPAA